MRTERIAFFDMSLAVSLAVSLVFILLPLNAISTFVTDPQHQTGQDVIIEAQNGDTVNIYCRVNDGSNTTNWTIVVNDVTRELDFLLDGTGPSGYSYLSVASELINEANLTVSFTSSIDRAKISCTSESDSTQVTFYLGIPAAPILDSSTDDVDATEGTSVTVYLNSSNTNDPFPPATYTWTLNDGVITDNDTSVATYEVTFDPVGRAQSGTYKLRVTNTAGSDSGNFTLDVQYQPEGNIANTSVSVVLGGSVTMTAFTNYASNPPPLLYGWIAPMVMGFINTTNPRFSVVITDIVQLTITDASHSDNGSWTFGTANALGDTFTNIFLYIQFAPGAVTNLTSSSVTGNGVTLSWIAPSQSGYPSLSNYVISVTPAHIANITTASTNATLTGLRSATSYTIAVVAVSSLFSYGGDTWESTNVTTAIGLPAITSIAATSSNGNISITWNVHVGGLNKSEATIVGRCVLPSEMSGSGNEDNMTMMMMMMFEEFFFSCYGNQTSCLSDALAGSASVGPVYAGQVYYCDVGIITAEGYNIANTQITPTLGIPSVPIASFSALSDLLQLTIRSVYAGVSMNDNSFQFRAIATCTTGENSVYSQGIANYIDNQTETWDIVIPGGSYMVSLVAVNSYGTSEQMNLAVVIPVGTSGSSTPTASAPPTASATPTAGSASGSAASSTVPIIVGSIVGVVILIVGLVVIGVGVVYMIKKKAK